MELDGCSYDVLCCRFCLYAVLWQDISVCCWSCAFVLLEVLYFSLCLWLCVTIIIFWLSHAVRCVFLPDLRNTMLCYVFFTTWQFAIVLFLSVCLYVHPLHLWGRSTWLQTFLSLITPTFWFAFTKITGKLLLKLNASGCENTWIIKIYCFQLLFITVYHKCYVRPIPCEAQRWSSCICWTMLLLKIGWNVNSWAAHSCWHFNLGASYLKLNVALFLQVCIICKILDF